ncbi:hypothetical protein K466DRAFT_20940 [Polyporus arcularius HHB13444]|uniref:Secreted protein n=1 Tax=Polyporus arcularius HHB13444 TaxID=1314778 RepID=A0A5C3PX08_9APHY|nr:hypothetical protein K466DRAFT_20940 [Polyporus arcularius HHB13444]
MNSLHVLRAIVAVSICVRADRPAGLSGPAELVVTLLLALYSRRAPRRAPGRVSPRPRHCGHCGWKLVEREAWRTARYVHSMIICSDKSIYAVVWS